MILSSVDVDALFRFYFFYILVSRKVCKFKHRCIKTRYV